MISFCGFTDKQGKQVESLQGWWLFYQQKIGLNNRYADFINQHVGETT
jgi:hypothetical protein